MAMALGSLTGDEGVQAQDRPTFRSAVRLIDVDVFVTDRDGRFVRDLTVDDFELLEDGQPQTIATFSFTDLPVGRPAPRTAELEEFEPDVVTNNTPAGRVYVLLMDSPSTGGG
jgi:VWFA-related protein